MNAATRIALVGRIARAIAWNALDEDEQRARLRDADQLIAELEAANEQRDRTGWIFVDLPPDDAEVES